MGRSACAVAGGSRAGAARSMKKAHAGDRQSRHGTYCALAMDLRSESDIEQLRHVALAQQIQIEQLLAMLRAKCDELAALKGSEGELQQTLSLAEDLSRKAQAVAAQIETPPGTPANGSKDRKPRESFGPTEQPKLPVVEQTFELDDADKTGPSCGGTLAPMKGRFETSEMIDVVEVSYRVVRVQQQKYACKCGGCIETALGPERATPGGRYSLDWRRSCPVPPRSCACRCARRRVAPRRHAALSPVVVEHFSESAPIPIGEPPLQFRFLRCASLAQLRIRPANRPALSMYRGSSFGTKGSIPTSSKKANSTNPITNKTSM